mmetsp:Transcript_98940/g.307752  ORF Transcript_98940/g.307752 Transcript_98940/m.307752 type:complete len:773 (-) Transcript_98940:145-2463(-)
MGEALSIPEDTDGHAGDSAPSPAGGSGVVPNEGVLLSQLIQLLSQRQRNSLLLSDLGALLPGPLRQRVKDQGGLRSWLQRYPSLFLVSGQPGKESVTLILGSSAVPAPELGAETATEDTSSCLPVLDQAPSGPGTVPSGGVAADVEVTCPFDEEVDGQAAVQLRGLPYRATAEDVRAFLGDFASQLVDDNPIHLVLNRDGRPSGFARVQFTSPEAARQCRDDLHLRSMEDRYVEVFLYSERPSRGRQRRGAHEDPASHAGGEAAARGLGILEAAAISRDQVVKECRVEMADPKKRRLLLSMLGVALSPGARAYLKQMDQGLKNFLAQFPGEFSVEGGKGCEYVTYTPTLHLSEAIDNSGPGTGTIGTSAMGFQRAVGSSAPPRGGNVGHSVDELPASPKPTKTPPTEPTPSAGRGLATPSDWGTPSAAAPWGSTPWLPPWPSAAAAAAGSGLQGGDGGATPWGAPPPAWPMPSPQFWPGWPATQYTPWSQAQMLEGVAHASTAAGAAVFSTPAAPEGASGTTAAASGTLQNPFALAGSLPDATASKGGTHGSLAAAVRLRGLPFSASEQDVLAFFAQHDIVDRITDGPKAVNLLLRSNGRPSGQAVVQMRDRADAELAQRVLSGKWMGSRYIEVFLYGEDGAEPNTVGPGGPAALAAASTAGAVRPAGPLLGAAERGAATAPAQNNAGPAALPGLGAVAFAGAPGWPLAPWGAAPAGLQNLGASLGGSDAPETSWEALFEFLGPEGSPPAVSVGGVGAPGDAGVPPAATAAV